MAERQTEPPINAIINVARQELHKYYRELAAYFHVIPEEVSFSEVKSMCRDYIAHEISLDNDSYMSILKKRDRIKRQEECKAFAAKVASEAKKRTIDKVNEIASKAAATMVEDLEKELGSKQGQIEQKRKTLNVS